jgi:hypothetical protein
MQDRQLARLESHGVPRWLARLGRASAARSCLTSACSCRALQFKGT